MANSRKGGSRKRNGGGGAMSRPGVRAAADLLQKAVEERRNAPKVQVDPDAEFVSVQVYHAMVAWKEEDGPARVMAPVAVGAEFASPLVARQLGLDPTDESVLIDVASFLTFAWIDRIANLDVKDFERWKETADARENAAAMGKGENAVTP